MKKTIMKFIVSLFVAMLAAVAFLLAAPIASEYGHPYLYKEYQTLVGTYNLDTYIYCWDVKTQPTGRYRVSIFGKNVIFELSKTDVPEGYDCTKTWCPV